MSFDPFTCLNVQKKIPMIVATALMESDYDFHQSTKRWFYYYLYFIASIFTHFLECFNKVSLLTLLLIKVAKYRVTEEARNVLSSSFRRWVYYVVIICIDLLRRVLLYAFLTDEIIIVWRCLCTNIMRRLFYVSLVLREYILTYATIVYIIRVSEWSMCQDDIVNHLTVADYKSFVLDNQ